MPHSREFCRETKIKGERAREREKGNERERGRNGETDTEQRVSRTVAAVATVGRVLLPPFVAAT